jgi:hypothetical protein
LKHPICLRAQLQSKFRYAEDPGGYVFIEVEKPAGNVMPNLLVPLRVLCVAAEVRRRNGQVVAVVRGRTVRGILRAVIGLNVLGHHPERGDHLRYLARELRLAVEAMVTGRVYRQDAMALSSSGVSWVPDEPAWGAFNDIGGETIIDPPPPPLDVIGSRQHYIRRVLPRLKQESVNQPDLLPIINRWEKELEAK